jgi:hypothetical protein
MKQSAPFMEAEPPFFVPLPPLFPQTPKSPLIPPKKQRPSASAPGGAAGRGRIFEQGLEEIEEV